MSNIIIASKLAEIAGRMPSLRDQFAMAAMQGLLASNVDMDDATRNSGYDRTVDLIAACSYEQADAMLLAREREK